jgi:heme exporter protein CcmD
MGGYAFYVWGAYGLTLLAMSLEVFALVRRHKALRDHPNTAKEL